MCFSLCLDSFTRLKSGTTQHWNHFAGHTVHVWVAKLLSLVKIWIFFPVLCLLASRYLPGRIGSSNGVIYSLYCRCKCKRVGQGCKMWELLYSYTGALCLTLMDEDSTRHDDNQNLHPQYTCLILKSVWNHDIKVFLGFSRCAALPHFTLKIQLWLKSQLTHLQTRVTASTGSVVEGKDRVASYASTAVWHGCSDERDVDGSKRSVSLNVSKAHLNNWIVVAKNHIIYLWMVPRSHLQKHM